MPDVPASGSISPNDGLLMMTDYPSWGKVYLVGAGPGDPELLTMKAHRLLHEVDVVLHDALVDEDLLESIPDRTVVRDVGKRPNGKRTSQAEINDLLVSHAQAGRDVVRLKGGDPTVFGRGGEEAEILAEAGVPVEIVPGVTSVVGGPGVVGIPLTHREHASSVTVITGHEAPDKPDSSLDWDALAATVKAGGTLVIVMGVRTLPKNVAALQNRGVSSGCPVAMIEKATWEDEHIVTGTLGSIVDASDAAGIEPPALTVIGDVVSVRDRVRSALQRDAGTVLESPIAIPAAELSFASQAELPFNP